MFSFELWNVLFCVLYGWQCHTQNVLFYIQLQWKEWAWQKTHIELLMKPLYIEHVRPALLQVKKLRKELSKQQLFKTIQRHQIQSGNGQHSRSCCHYNSIILIGGSQKKSWDWELTQVTQSHQLVFKHSNSFAETPARFKKWSQFYKHLYFL